MLPCLISFLCLTFKLNTIFCPETSFSFPFLPFSLLFKSPLHLPYLSTHRNHAQLKLLFSISPFSTPSAPTLLLSYLPYLLLPLQKLPPLRCRNSFEKSFSNSHPHMKLRETLFSHSFSCCLLTYHSHTLSLP